MEPEDDDVLKLDAKSSFLVGKDCVTKDPLTDLSAERKTAMETKSSFCVSRKRKIDKARAASFLESSADSDDETQLSQVFDWMDPVAVKKTAIALEDRASKRQRLKAEGVVLAEEGRFWEAIKKWESSLSLSEFSQVHCQHRASLVNGGDEDKGKDEKLKRREEFKDTFQPSGDRLLDAQLLEMKAQVLMELDEAFPAVQAAEAAVLSNPLWHIAWRTLGRAHIGFGDIEIAIKSFSRAIHLQPDDEETWKQDMHWAVEIREKQTHTQSEELTSAVQCCCPHQTVGASPESHREIANKDSSC